MLAVEEINFNLVIVVISSILSFVTGWGLSVLREKQRMKQTVTQSLKSMINELEYIQLMLEDIKEPLISIDKANPNSLKFNFSYQIMPIASYESMLHSGVLKEIDVSTQLYIIRFYEEAKFFDKIRYRMVELATATSKSVFPDYINNIEHFSIFASKVLKGLKESLNELLDMLKPK